MEHGKLKYAGTPDLKHGIVYIVTQTRNAIANPVQLEGYAEISKKTKGEK